MRAYEFETVAWTKEQVNCCWCCENEISLSEQELVSENWENRMDGYCYSCASARCDAFPGECPRKKVETFQREKK